MSVCLLDESCYYPEYAIDEEDQLMYEMQEERLLKAAWNNLVPDVLLNFVDFEPSSLLPLLPLNKTTHKFFTNRTNRVCFLKNIIKYCTHKKLVLNKFKLPRNITSGVTNIDKNVAMLNMKLFLDGVRDPSKNLSVFKHVVTHAKGNNDMKIITNKVTQINSDILNFKFKCRNSDGIFDIRFGKAKGISSTGKVYDFKRINEANMYSYITGSNITNRNKQKNIFENIFKDKYVTLFCKKKVDEKCTYYECIMMYIRYEKN